MKKYYVFGLMFIVFIAVSIISPTLFTQSYRLTKVGYVDLERVIREVTKDQELVDKLKEKIEAEKSKLTTSDDDTSDSNIANSRDNSFRGQIKRQVASALISIVRKDGYTLILERTENSILYADREFDITDAVITAVKESVNKPNRR